MAFFSLNKCAFWGVLTTFHLSFSVSFFRMGDYKLIEGNPGLYHGWYPPPEDESILDTDQFNEIPLVPQLYNLKGMWVFFNIGLFMS